jgi:hypothetical protein
MSLETMMFQIGSKVVTRRPGDDNDSDVEAEGDDEGENKITPRQQNFKQGGVDGNEGPYETPFILRTKPWAPSVQVEKDTEAEDSEIEREVRREKKKATRVSSQVVHQVMSFC